MGKGGSGGGGRSEPLCVTARPHREGVGANTGVTANPLWLYWSKFTQRLAEAKAEFAHSTACKFTMPVSCMLRSGVCVCGVCAHSQPLVCKHVAFTVGDWDAFRRHPDTYCIKKGRLQLHCVWLDLLGLGHVFVTRSPTLANHKCVHTGVTSLSLYVR